MARLSYLEAFRLAVTVGKTAALFHVITHYGIVTTGVEGASMLPTVHIMGQTAVISSRYRHGRGVQVGDLVTYDIPISRNTCGLKRVVGMPGDYVTIQAPQAPNGAGDTMMQVPQGHCWLVGDNLTVSRDSRDFGPVPLGLIRGKALMLLWPFKWLDNGLTKVE
ncbi:hypothetical protein VUR80DRAFT_5776 [Thermomyces stellatus]